MSLNCDDSIRVKLLIHTLKLVEIKNTPVRCTTLADRRRLDVFDMRCQRHLLRVFCQHHISNQPHHPSYDNAA